jgi:hypothetical protein
LDRQKRLRNDLKERKCVKVISGISNFDTEKAMKIVRSATATNATAVDVAATTEIVTEARRISDIVLFASSIDPKQLYTAIKNGADVAELGNFDNLYTQGMKISSEKVYELSMQTLELIGDEGLICITVPGHLPTTEQIDLANKLRELGIDIIQTEGYTTSNPTTSDALGLIQKVQTTLANTIELTRNVKDIPIITASGITPVTAPMAIAAGANGVGIGRFINNLNMEIEMLAAIRSVIESINTFRPVFETAGIR